MHECLHVAARDPPCQDVCRSIQADYPLHPSLTPQFNPPSFPPVLPPPPTSPPRHTQACTQCSHRGWPAMSWRRISEWMQLFGVSRKLGFYLLMMAKSFKTAY